MKKRANNEIFLPKIMIAIALIAILGVALWGFFGQDTVAVQNAKEAYAQYLSENPGSQDKDFIYIYEDTVIVAIRNGKVVRKEYATEADAVKAALGSKDGANYSLAGTGNGKLFVVKLFEKTDDIYALGTSTLATGADKLSIKVVSNGMIFATFEIPAEAIDRKQSPVGVTIKKINAEDYITLREDQGGFGYDIDVTNLVENNTARIAITINGPKGLVADTNKSPITAYHKDKVISSTYDAKTGQISFSTTSFSPFPFVIENVKTVTTVEDLRYYLQHKDSWNIKLGDDITIDLKTDRDGHVADSTAVNKKTVDGEDIYYSSGYYDTDGTPRWLYFGAVVRGIKYLDLNGKTITYTNTETNSEELAKYEDSALFCVDGGTYFGIGGDTGTIQTKIDEYTVWAVEDNCVVSIHGGNFVADKYAGATADPNRAILYSSSGEIHVYGGKFYYENTNEGDTEGEFKTNGGFNVLNGIAKPSIWIYPGVYMSEPLYRQAGGTDDNKLDNDSIILVGGTVTEYHSALKYGDFTGKWYTITASDLKVSLPYIDEILYRVGNLNEIPLKYLFKIVNRDADGKILYNEDGTISYSQATDFGKYNIRVIDIIKTDLKIAELEKNYGSSNYYAALAEQPVEGATCVNGVLTFPTTFTGPVKIGLYDETSNAIHAQLFLEVVDGKNATSAMSATGNNVCLLSDISTTGISVSGGYALYGNGFTITDGRALSSTASTNGVVNVNNGIIENVYIHGYNPASSTLAWSSDEGFAPAVNITGDAKIYSSYIYGGRSAVRAFSGTILLDNVTLDGGSLGNMQIFGANVTLKNCTTTADTQGGPKGFGIVVCNTLAKVTVEGTISQYNWLTLDQVGAISDKLETPMKDIFGNSSYYRTGTDNAKYVNMGFFFGDVENLTAPYTKMMVIPTDGTEGMLKDKTATSTQYGCEEKTSGITVTAYLPYSTTFGFDYPSVEDWKPIGYHIYKPTWSFTFKDYDADDSTDELDPWCVYENGVIDIGVTKATTTEYLDLSGIETKWYGRKVNYSLWLSSDGVNFQKIEDEDKGNVALDTTNQNYVIEVRISYCNRTSNGEPISDDEYYSYPIPIKISKVAFPAPQWIDLAASNTGSKHFWHQTGAVWDYNYQKAVPAYNGIKVTFYDTAGKTHTIDFTEVSQLPTLIDGKYVLSVTGTGTDFSGTCMLTISPVVTAAKDKTYEFKTCKYSKDDQLVRVYWHGTDPHDNKETSQVKLQYAFTDPNGRTIEGVTVSYDFSSSSLTVMSNSDFTSGGPSSGSSSGGGGICVTPDTLVTLADGTQKRIDELTAEDKLLVWDFYKGGYTISNIALIVNHGYDLHSIVELTFEGGARVKVVDQHAFFDADVNKWIVINPSNASGLIGHEFTLADGDTFKTEKLVDVKITKEYTEAWGLITDKYYNCIANGVFSNAPIIPFDGEQNFFAVNDDMKYDAEAKTADIEKYGLYTYEEFAHLMTREEFETFNIAEFKISVGKGHCTHKDVVANVVEIKHYLDSQK